MGGCCQICGYDKCPEAMDLHHLDPNEKEISFGRVVANPCSWEKKVVPELRKCILLCSNCHREFHNGYVEIPKTFSIFDENFADYRKNNEELENCPICNSKMAHQRKTCSLSCAAKFTRNLRGGYKPRFKILTEDYERLTLENKTDKEICDYFNCAETTLFKFRKRLSKSKGEILKSKKFTINWPPVEKIKSLIDSKSLYDIARDLNVSHNAVKKFCIRNNIELKPKGFWKKK